jgi:Suv3 C-terminal domain 1
LPGADVQVQAYAISKGYPDECTFSVMLEHFALEAQQDDVYRLCNHEGMLQIAAALDSFPQLSLLQRHTFSTAPIDPNKSTEFGAFMSLVQRCALLLIWRRPCAR